MDKLPSRAAARAYLRTSRTLFLQPDEGLARAARERTASLDKARARAACAQMGVLHSIVVTVDPHRRRRTWYIVEPDRSASAQYAAMGLDLAPGCKVLVDAQAMRPVALLDLDSSIGAPGVDTLPHGFNPYFDLPPG